MAVDETVENEQPELNERQLKVVEQFSDMLGHQKTQYVTYGVLEELLIKLVE